ncbi:hypothetical protein [Micromonospora thermarum]|uniref:Uncharacterized protein n=1 Tax=Micromonospora thermarum TaxID=2720024 RepID=A0ABX0Z6V8_9ACTN|nr:hypothetical protein [Micromonospora thermarum]NJP32883.1 hypothetical protein [Micromonospora thermarum]
MTAQPGSLPALPACARPADVRIEVYGGDSLDASVYVCRQHVTLSAAALDAYGWRAEPAAVRPLVTRPCGYAYRYPTGRLADLAHPHWCDRRGCLDRHRHRSLRLPVTSGRPEASIAEVSLSQGLTAGLEPVIALAVADAGNHEVTLSLGQGRVLSYQVRRLLDLTSRRRGR